MQPLSSGPAKCGAAGYPRRLPIRFISNPMDQALASAHPNLAFLLRREPKSHTAMRAEGARMLDRNHHQYDPRFLAGLRYHYLVAHRTTGEAIWVGSQCVLNFELGEEAQQHRLKSQRESQQAHHEQIHQDRVQSLIEQIQTAYQIAGESEKRKIRWIVGKFQRRAVFSPRDAAWLLQVLLVCGVKPDVENFPISLRRKSEKTELKGLSVTEKNLVSACLTDEQKQLCAQLGIRLTY